MLSLMIKDLGLTIKDVEKSQLEKIVNWFACSDINLSRFSMGIDKPVTYNELYEKYLESLINAHEFFLGINIDANLIGFFKGRVDYKDEGEVWIMAMLIDAPYQNNGIGKRVLNLIMKEFKEKFGFNNFYVCVVKENVEGRAFWERNGFSEHRLSKGYFTINNKSYDLMIMYSQLTQAR